LPGLTPKSLPISVQCGSGALFIATHGAQESWRDASIRLNHDAIWLQFGPDWSTKLLFVCFLFCNNQPEMSAIIGAVDTPYYGWRITQGA
jgi:hypothetical protein